MRTLFRIFVLTTVGLCSVLVLGGAPASAGGGCHAGITTGDATDSDEATIEMLDACFTPTTLEVDPGTAVTFVNRDVGLTHNVGGNRWGHFEDMSAGDAFTATFDDPGTYPYACSYHLGMTGAVIVGDGTGAGNGETVGLKTFQASDADTTIPARGSTSDWLVPAVLGLVIGAATALGLARGRRAAAAS